MSPDTTHAGQRPQIERQRRLPFLKAVEIAAKSFRVRFWRSMLTVSSIILAIAFLMWQLTSAEVLRHLEDVAKRPEEVEADAARFKEAADQRQEAADRYQAEIQPILDRFANADARLTAAVNLAKVAPATARLAEAQAALQEADQALTQDLLDAQVKYDALTDRISALQRQLRATDVIADSTRRDQLREAISAAQEERAALDEAYRRYRRAWTDREAAVAAVKLARELLAKAEEEAAAARKKFPDQAPAPDPSAELDRLVKARDAARREKERVDRRLAVLKGRADRAASRHKAATASALKQRLAVEGEETVEQTPVHLPWGLRLTSARLWIIVLALMVCLVGITNAMLMSVTERYREIGTMKCLGALDTFIVKIFLLESSFMGSVGVLMGIVLGFVLALVVQMGNFGAFVTRYFPLGGILKWAAVAFAVGTVLTVLGGILPAVRAAKMQPVDAMRIEE